MTILRTLMNYQNGKKFPLCPIEDVFGDPLEEIYENDVI